VTTKLADAARKLLATESGEVATQDVAMRATQACEQLAQPLSRLIGDLGIRTLLNRSLYLASASFPWLAGANVNRSSDGTATAFRTRMESQSPEEAADAFVLVLSTVVGLLEKLIGAGLVTRVLHELWPVVFRSAVVEEIL
jgi:hypothetical protein